MQTLVCISRSTEPFYLLFTRSPSHFMVFFITYCVKVSYGYGWMAITGLFWITLGWLILYEISAQLLLPALKINVLSQIVKFIKAKVPTCWVLD